MLSILALLLICNEEVSASYERITLPFDYNWKFTTGDPSTAKPALTTVVDDPSFQSMNGKDCTQLEWAPRGGFRNGGKKGVDLDLCKAACAAIDGCMVCFIKFNSQFKYPIQTYDFILIFLNVSSRHTSLDIVVRLFMRVLAISTIGYWAINLYVHPVQIRPISLEVIARLFLYPSRTEVA